MIGRKRDNISRALRSLGYDPQNYSETILQKFDGVAFYTMSIGTNGKVTQTSRLLGTSKEYNTVLDQSVISALVSAGEFIFLCGSISESEKKRIEKLVP